MQPLQPHPHNKVSARPDRLHFINGTRALTKIVFFFILFSEYPLHFETGKAGVCFILMLTTLSVTPFHDKILARRLTAVAHKISPMKNVALQ